MVRPAALMNRAVLRSRILKMMRSDAGRKAIQGNPRLAKLYAGAESTQFGDFVHDYIQASRAAIGGKNPAGAISRAYLKHLDKHPMSPLRKPLFGKGPAKEFSLSHYRRMGMQGPWESAQHWNWEKDLMKNHNLATRHGFTNADAMGRAYGNDALPKSLKRQLSNVYKRQGAEYNALESKYRDTLNHKFVNQDQAFRQITRDPDLQPVFRRMALMNIDKAAPRYGRILAAGAGTGMTAGSGIMAANLRHMFPKKVE